MDDMASEKSQSSETSRTLVNPEVSQSFLLSGVKQTSDVSRFEFSLGRRRKDMLPAEKSVDASSPEISPTGCLKADTFAQNLSSNNYLCLLPIVFQWNGCRAILPASVAASLKLMLVSCLALILFPQNFLK